MNENDEPQTSIRPRYQKPEIEESARFETLALACGLTSDNFNCVTSPEGAQNS